MNRRLRILGTRGIPASHGGFETFAERLALYLVERGWQVTVYCQGEAAAGDDPAPRHSRWRGVDLVTFPIARGGAAGTVLFDYRSTRHAARSGEPVLTLGYNTAVLALLYRFAGVTNCINMDGLEWKRDKWPWYAKAWLFANERLGAWLGTHLIADHPRIAARLEQLTRAERITTIPYGADEITQADPACLAPLGLQPGNYVTIIARPEPENSFLEAVTAFCAAPRSCKLVVLGRFADDNPYHRAVRAAANEDVVFPGAIYDRATVDALRLHCRAYLHGHRVGGTNPSLVEALGAGCAVIAHDNEFNRWVAGDGAAYFSGSADLADLLARLLDDEGALARMRQASRARHREAFTWPRVLGDYESLLARVGGGAELA